MSRKIWGKNNIHIDIPFSLKRRANQKKEEANKTASSLLIKSEVDNKVIYQLRI